MSFLYHHYGSTQANGYPGEKSMSVRSDRPDDFLTHLCFIQLYGGGDERKKLSDYTCPIV